MNKKIVIVLALLFSLFFLSSYVSAMDSIKNGMNDMGNNVKSSWNSMTNSMENMGNNMAGYMNNMTNNNDDTGYMTATDYNDYTTTRTATAYNTNGMTGTTWAWFIIAIIAIMIVALIWYYNMQNTNVSHNE